MELSMAVEVLGTPSSTDRVTIPVVLTRSRSGIRRTLCLRESDLCRVRCGMFKSLLCSVYALGKRGRLMRSRTMAVIHSENVLLQDIYVNNTSNSGSVSSNTDGANTIYSKNIEFARWSVTNGDDSISMKANSTNILIRDSQFYRGLGISFGSIGQYKGVYETIENVVARNITCYETTHASYIKTWTGQQVGYPPNGGGGGLGRMLPACPRLIPSNPAHRENSLLTLL
jgi:hypothetical protein